MKVTFSHKNKKHKVEYFLWEKINGWKFTTSINEKNNKLYLSSLRSEGILVVDDFSNQLKKSITKG